MKQNSHKLDFGWGNPYFLLDILSKKYNALLKNDINNMYYGPDEGDKELISLTKATIQRTMGMDYKYVFITHGATQALNIILKYAKIIEGYTNVFTAKYGYPFYNDMIKYAGMNRIIDESKMLDGLVIIDSPSNPEGNLITKNFYNIKYDRVVVWDSVYHNKIYSNNLKKYPIHDIMVGSYSKLLGITGARVGFIAMNNPIYYNYLVDISLKDIATMSIPSQKLIIDILNTINLDAFISEGKTSIDYNRESFTKIEYLFDMQPVPDNGMFYAVYADNSAINLLNKCNIIYTKLDNGYIRLNLGQTNKLTAMAVKTILIGDNKK